jgi:hypothetical protein
LGVGSGANDLIPEKTTVTETEVKQNRTEPLLTTFGTKQKTKIGFWNEVKRLANKLDGDVSQMPYAPVRSDRKLVVVEYWTPC